MSDVEHGQSSVRPTIADREGDLRGKVTALLAEIARAPEEDVTSWESGLKPGAVVGRFELLRELGRGGFGVVFEARDRELGRLVAFKAVRPGTRARAAQRGEWLAREAEAAAQLNHENIVALHDVGRGEHGPYLIFELLEGETLGERLRRGPLTLGATLHVALAVARALAWAHASGVIHRDLKPSNVFLTARGHVKVLDFGLARVFGRAGSESGGTPAYMAPEQWRGEREDERTDVFALGVLLYEMLTGRVPFEIQDGRSSVLRDDLPPSLEGIPLGLRRIVRSALSADPAHRPRTVEAVIEVLESIDARRRARRPRRRAIACVAAVALVSVAAAAMWHARAERGAVEQPERVTVAIADIANDTGDPDLDALSALLATSLEQSRRVDVMTRSRMVDQASQLGRHEAHVDAAVALDVAKSAGAGVLLESSVKREGDMFAVDVEALAPATERTLFRVRDQASARDRLPTVIDRLSLKVLTRLRDKADEGGGGRAPIGRITSADLDAYAHYYRAQQFAEALDWAGANEEISAALESDPQFALAYWLRSYIGEFTGERMDARRADARRALSLGARLPRKERLLVEAWTAHAGGDDEKAAALYEHAVEQFPNDKHVLFLAGDLAHHAGRSAHAAELFLRALRVDPDWTVAATHAVEDLARIDRKDQLLEVAQRTVEASPVAASFTVLCLARRYRDETNEAIAACRRAVEVGGGAPAMQALSDTFLWAERLDEAETWAERMMDPAMPPSARLEGWHQRVKVLGMRGKYAEAIRTLDRIPRAVQVADPAHHHDFASEVLALARADPARLALTSRGRHDSWVPAELAYTGDLRSAATLAHGIDGAGWRALYEGVVAWRNRDVDTAIARMMRAAQSRSRAEVLAHLYLGELFGELGRDGEAVDQIREFQANPEMDAARCFGYARSLLLSARSLERLGMRRDALQDVNHLLRLWRDADADAPELSEAHALAARLGGSGPRR